MSNPTLPEFLRQRITEQSARAHTALDAEPSPDHTIQVVGGKFDVSEDAAPFAIRWYMTNEASPKNTIQDCTAKAHVLERHPGATAHGECPGCGRDSFGEWVTGPGQLCPEQRDMALAFADHSDYQESWKP